jgi:hypothetical protein
MNTLRHKKCGKQSNFNNIEKVETYSAVFYEFQWLDKVSNPLDKTVII